MARDDYGDGIVMVSLAYGAKGPGATNLAGNLSIGAGFAIRNAQQRMPALLLKFGSFKVQFAGKVAQLAAEISLKLFFIWAQRWWRFDPVLPFSGWRKRAAKINIFSGLALQLRAQVFPPASACGSRTR